MLVPYGDRADLFRLLGDEARLQVLALCAEEPLTVSELAELLHDSQPQLTRKTQPLRQAGLLTARKDGTRTYLSTVVGRDPVITAALDEGRRLCRKDKSLARLPRVLLDREERSRHFFEQAPATSTMLPSTGALAFLPMIRPLLGARAEGLCVDVGAGDGALLPVLSPLFARVFAVDRSPARLAACARVVADHALANVRLLEAKLSAEYFDVVTAMNGVDALDAVSSARIGTVAVSVRGTPISSMTIGVGPSATASTARAASCAASTSARKDGLLESAAATAASAVRARSVGGAPAGAGSGFAPPSSAARARSLSSVSRDAS